MAKDSISALMAKEANYETTGLSDLTTLQIVQMINDQDKTVAVAIESVLADVSEAIDAICARVRNGGRIFYVGAGTSGRLAVLDSAECPPTFGTDPELVQSIIAGGLGAMLSAVESVEDSETSSIEALISRSVTSSDVVIGISASGRTPFALSALQYGNRLGCLTLAICTRGECAMQHEANIAIAPDVGAEVLTGSSRMKSGTAQKMILGMLSTGVMTKLGKVHNNLMIDLVPNNEKLLRRAESIVASICNISPEEAADYLKKSSYQPRIAVLMKEGNMSVQQATEFAGGNFQSLNEQLEKLRKH